MKDFDEIKSRNDLANFLSIKHGTLTYLLYVQRVDNCYKLFKIPKKSGGEREICAPTYILKSVQKKLERRLVNYYEIIKDIEGIKTNISHGFEKEKSIITNAKIHINKRYVINIDLENFFGSFHFGRVRGFFEKNRYFSLPLEIATIIAQLTCYKGTLPQGAPTSPIITNLICQILDYRILKIAKQYKLDYTRYADDLTFSTNNKHIIENYDNFFDKLKNEINRAGFKINDKKTRILYKDSRQEVTGVVVNKKINIPQEYYRQTRAMAHALYFKSGFLINGKPGTLEQLEGRFSFLYHLDCCNSKNDISKSNTKEKLTNFNGKGREFKRFLFYKYFYCNDAPLIVTEGKTDIKYLQAALKSLYKSYPNLIYKDAHGKFKFKIKFLKRTEKIKKFFGVTPDGGDTIGNIYKFFKDDSNKVFYPNYFEYFSQRGVYPKNPVILLYDNEIANNSKPLKKFMNAFAQDKIEEIKKDLWIEMQSEANIYVLTNKLNPNESEASIEHLFSNDTLSIKLGGKELSLDNNADSSMYYGKEIFSQYVMTHYKDIDFTGFHQILETIDFIVSSYTPYASSNK